MTYRSLLVFLDSDPMCAARTQVAMRLAQDLDCHLVGVAPTGIVELPPEWLRDDAAYFDTQRISSLRPHTAPSAVEDIFKAEFDGAWNERGLFLLTLHPHVIGHRSRIVLLERLLRYIRQRGKVWFGTLEEVARWCNRSK